MEQGDRGRVPSVLATDPHLEIRLDRTGPLDGEADQCPDTVGIDAVEGIPRQEAVLEVGLHQTTFDVVPAEAEGHLGEVVGPEGEEVGLAGDLIGADRGSRGLDHGADAHVAGGQAGARGTGQLLLDPAPGEGQLGLRHHEGDHDLDDGTPTRGPPVGRGLEQGAHLHPVEPVLQDPEPDATGSQHRVGLLPAAGRRQQVRLLLVEAALACLLDDEALHVGEELVQGRVEQAHRHGQPVHRLEDPLEVLTLHSAQFVERGGFALRRVGEDHAAHDRQPVPEEHVLGAAQADALRAVLAGPGGVLRRVGVGADPECVAPHLIGPGEDGVELGRGLPHGEVHGAEDDLAGGAVDGDHVALVDDRVAHPEVVGAHDDGLGPAHRGLAPPTGDHGGVADQPATRREDALGHLHAVDVLGRGLLAHQDHLLAVVGGADGLVGVEIGHAHRGPGRRRQAGGEDLVLDVLELGVEDLVEVVGRHPLDGLGVGEADGRVVGHRDGEAQGGRAGALAHPGLEHPELALLDGELGVAHVPVVLLEGGEDLLELAVQLGPPLAHLVQRLCGAYARHHVLTLGVDEEVPEAAGRAGRRIAGEAHPRARLVVAVAEHHGLDVDGGAEVVGQMLASAVGHRPR